MESKIISIGAHVRMMGTRLPLLIQVMTSLVYWDGVLATTAKTNRSVYCATSLMLKKLNSTGLYTCLRILYLFHSFELFHCGLVSDYLFSESLFVIWASGVYLYTRQTSVITRLFFSDELLSHGCHLWSTANGTCIVPHTHNTFVDINFVCRCGTVLLTTGRQLRTVQMATRNISVWRLTDDVTVTVCLSAC